MIAPHPRVWLAAPVVLAVLLVACSSQGNYRKDAAHEKLLQALRACLVDVPLRGEKGKEFISPCIRMDVSPLNGIPRGRLIDALGPAQFCTGQVQGSSFPTKEDCPFEQNPQWSFYRLADPTVSGGGPELICEANSHMYCVTVEWRRSK